MRFCSRNCWRKVGSAIRHCLSDELDLRYWFRVWLFMLVDAILLIVATVEAWEDELARIYLMLANTFSIIGIALSAFFFKSQMKTRAALLEAFTEADTDKDGYLTETEVLKFVEQYPPGSFKRFKIKNKLIAFESLAIAKVAPRSHLCLRFVEFVADWLSFGATLILFNTGSASDLLVISQGIFAVFDLFFVLHEVQAGYFTKYKFRWKCCWLTMMLVYWNCMLGLLSLMFAGFTVSLELQSFVGKPEIQDTQTTNAVQSVGFWTGWLITAVMIINFVAFALVYFCLSHCGCVTYRGRRHFGDKPLLGKVKKGGADDDDDDDEELDDDDFEAQPVDFAEKARKIDEEQYDNLQIVTNFSSSTDINGGQGKTPEKPADYSSLMRYCCCCCCGCKC